MNATLCRAALAIVLVPLPSVRAEGEPAFPRRALVITAHDYLYANPVYLGEFRVVEAISKGKGFRVPASQVLHLSDADKPITPPVKAVLEATLAKFLATSRVQDRIVVLFAGHALEIGGEAYLVPLDGQFGVKQTLVPLRWVYERLKECKARQKVLILDICPRNPLRGELRPQYGPMTPELDEGMKKVPAGVQVWVSCSAGEHSLATEEGAVFLDALTTAEREIGGEQHPADLIPLEKLVDAVNEQMKRSLAPLKLTQSSRLLGEASKLGAPYAPRESAPPRPIIEGLPAVPAVVQGILRELNVPALRKVTRPGVDLIAEGLLFDPMEMAKVAKGNAPARVKQAIDQARVYLWASSGEKPPEDLAEAVRAARQGPASAVLLPFEVLRAPLPGSAGEVRFKMGIYEHSRALASVLLLHEETLDLLKTAGKEQELPRRWQAHLDYVTARMFMQTAFLYEYASALGSMRKELPWRDPALHTGWALASQSRMAGDVAGKKLAREAQRRFKKLIADYPGTPWEVLARRDQLTALGLEWTPRR